MDENYRLFLNDIPANFQGFVIDLNEYLLKKECKRKIKTAKNGFVTSYLKPKSEKTLLNYVFRKTGVKMRIYAAGVGGYDVILNDYPEQMKKEIRKACDCKKLIGGICSPTCPSGYTFCMDGVEYKKCRNMAFFHNLDEVSAEYILKMLKTELAMV